MDVTVRCDRASHNILGRSQVGLLTRHRRAISKGGQDVEKTFHEESLLGPVEASSIHPRPGCARAVLVQSSTESMVGLCRWRSRLPRYSTGSPSGLDGATLAPLTKRGEGRLLRRYGAHYPFDRRGAARSASARSVFGLGEAAGRSQVSRTGLGKARATAQRRGALRPSAAQALGRAARRSLSVRSDDYSREQ